MIHGVEMSPTGELITDAGAVAAMTTPLWLPWLQSTSALAALILPILGATWLAVQIGVKIYLAFKGKLK